MEFDALTWRSRSHGDDVAGIYSLARIVPWCARRGITVRFLSGIQYAFYHPPTRSSKATIDVPLHTRPSRQAAALLHECGHHLIWESGTACNDEPVTLLERINELEEEFEAWRRGKKLGTRLGVIIDWSTYDDARARSLVTYCGWAVTGI